MTDHTPTTVQEVTPVHSDWFAKWLTEHDAAVKAEALRDAAMELENMGDCEALRAANWLYARAARIENGEEA